MPKYLKIPANPDSSPCRCTSGDPDCDHWESCDGCGMDYRKHEGHDCIDGVPVQGLRAMAKELRDSLAACETERDRLRAELDAAHDGEDALRSEVAKLRAQLAALQSVPQGVEVPDRVEQTIMHVPGESRGNCFAAVFAGLLQIPIESIPDFDGPDWRKQVNAFLRPYGLAWLQVGIDNEWLEDSGVSGMWHEVSGTTDRFDGKVRHSCVGLDAAVAWDPHPSQSGFVHQNGASIFVALQPWKMAHARLVPTPPQKTNRQLHEETAGMGLEEAFFRLNGIDPDATPTTPQPIQPEERRVGPDEVVVRQEYLGLLESAANRFCSSCRLRSLCTNPRKPTGCPSWTLDGARINAHLKRSPGPPRSRRWPRHCLVEVVGALVKLSSQRVPAHPLGRVGDGQPPHHADGVGRARVYPCGIVRADIADHAPDERIRWHGLDRVPPLLQPDRVAGVPGRVVGDEGIPPSLRPQTLAMVRLACLSV